MADRTEDSMNLDLNLGPVSGPEPVVGLVTSPSTGEAGNGNGNGRGVWNSSFIRDALRQRLHRNHSRWRRGHFVQFPLESLELMVDNDANGGDVGGGSGGDGDDDGGTGAGNGTVQAGEGSVTVAPESRDPDEVKTCENNVIALDNGALDDKEDVEKANSVGNFFDCNVCFGLARDPVVTSCGHLFCWPCIYKWFHIHSDAKECPGCKVEISLKNVTPIYGRGNNVVVADEPEEDSDIKVPMRPSARRVESLRQTILRTSSAFPMDEMLRRLGARFESSRNFFLANDGDDLPARLALHRIMTTRALRREQNPTVPPEVVDLTQDRPEEMLPRRRPPLINRSGQLPRIGEVPTTEATREASSRQSPPASSQDLQPPSMDDRDSFSSIGAVIHGESQTMDTAAEIDSVVSLSTSSSRRRNEPSRTSDVDSGDSRATRRRRLD